MRAFAPDVLVTQHGCDTHAEDPLAHLVLTVDAQRAAADALHDLAHEVCGGRWVALGGGGYELVDVVPRAWTHLTAIAAHAPDRARPRPCRRTGASTSSRSSGGRRRAGWATSTRPRRPHLVAPWDMGYNPRSEVDRAIMATRQAVFGTTASTSGSTERAREPRSAHVGNVGYAVVSADQRPEVWTFGRRVVWTCATFFAHPLPHGSHLPLSLRLARA